MGLQETRVCPEVATLCCPTTAEVGQSVFVLVEKCPATKCFSPEWLQMPSLQNCAPNFIFNFRNFQGKLTNMLFQVGGHPSEDDVRDPGNVCSGCGWRTQSLRKCHWYYTQAYAAFFTQHSSLILLGVLCNLLMVPLVHEFIVALVKIVVWSHGILGIRFPL